MKLTRASAYALHAVVHMAARKENTIVASHLVAQERGIPERFLLKVLKPLVSARVLQSVKGPNGGYRLARPATQITLLEIVEAVDGPIRGQVPFIQTNGEGGLHRQLEEVCSNAAERARKQLQKVRLSDLV
jgi:Rrf2 family protein